MKRTLVAFALLVPGVILAAADRPHLTSHPLDGTIMIDGRFDDWSGNAGSLEPFGSEPISIQAVNDSDFLYVRLSASDPRVRSQIVRQGLTVWFDPNGGTKKVLGIKYPVVEGGFGGGRRERSRGEDEGREPQPSDRVDILGPGKKNERSLTRDHLQGIDVALRTEQGTVQYELKVPLVRTSDQPYALETTSGKTIGVGLETGRPQQPAFEGERGGGGFGGGMGRRGGMGGRGGIGRRGGGERSFEPPKQLKGWATLALK